MRSIVFKTKSTPSSAVYVRSDAHCLLVVTHVSGDDQNIDPLVWQTAYDQLHDSSAINDVESVMDTLEKGSDSASIRLRDQHVFLGTHGSGVIYLKRGSEISEIVSDGFCAEGSWEEGDLYIATTDAFLEHIGGDEGLRYYFDHYRPEEVVEMMQTYDEGQTYGFGIASFAKLETISTDLPTTEIDEVIQTVSTDEGIEVQESVTKSTQGNITAPFLHTLLERYKIALIRFRSRFSRASLKPSRRFLLIIVPTIFLIYLAFRQSGLITYIKPNTESEYAVLIQTIDADLNRATTESFLNAGQSGEIFTSIEQKLATVSAQTKSLHSTELTQLAAKITQKKQELLRIDPVTIKEVFDIIVENPQVTVTDADLDGDTLYVLDGDRGVIYAISLTNRSYEVLTSDKIKNARLVAASSGYIYALTEREGVFLITTSRSVQVIPRDSEWGTITDMNVFNSNIYMLADGNKDIYKYIAIDTKSFAPRVSYLSAETAASFAGGKMMTLDGAVYVASSTSMKKFTSGNRSDFKAVFPNKASLINQIFASPDVPFTYVLDSKNTAIYSLEKTGAFHGQIIDPILAHASHVVSTGNDVFVVSGSKIYKISPK
ncbi:MAG: hypothetical protein WCO78_00850 [Candidatus Roizmanbacteria bacterium]